MSYSVGCRQGLDPALLWLWYRLAAIALIRPLAWELPYAAGEALKKEKKEKERSLLDHMQATTCTPQPMSSHLSLEKGWEPPSTLFPTPTLLCPPHHTSSGPQSGRCAARGKGNPGLGRNKETPEGDRIGKKDWRGRGRPPTEWKNRKHRDRQDDRR